MKALWYLAMQALAAVPPNPPRPRRLSVVWALAGMGGRLVRRQPAAGATVLVAVGLALPTEDTWKSGVWSLRVIAALLAWASCFVFDDAAADMLACSPTSLRTRSLIRVSFVLAWATPLWAVSLAVKGPHIPAVWLAWASVEFAALLAAVLAAAAAAFRWYGWPEPGVVASAAAVVGWLLLFVLPEPVAMFTLRPQDATLAHLRWTVLLGASLVVLAAAVRDPTRTTAT